MNKIYIKPLDKDMKEIYLSDQEVFAALLAGETIQIVSREEYDEVQDELYLNEKGELIRTMDSPFSLIGNCRKIKPKYININGFKIPEPVRECKSDKEYFIVDPYREEVQPLCGYYINGSILYHLISNGLVHDNFSAAWIHLNAILSFTKR